MGEEIDTGDGCLEELRHKKQVATGNDMARGSQFFQWTRRKDIRPCEGAVGL